MSFLAPRNLLILLCGIGTLAAPGCGLFRSDIPDAYSALQSRPLSVTSEPAASEAPPSDPMATTNLVCATMPAAPNSAPRADSEMPLALSSLEPAATATKTKAAPEANSCFVEIRAVGEEPQRIRMSLDDAVYVQKVLEQTGLVKKFRNMEIEISRKLENGTRHKLDVRYDAKRKHVVSAFDYALHPNDLIVIRQDNSSSFDEMLKKLAGPLAR